MSAIRNERPAADVLPPLSEVEGEIREFVRKDVASLRRFPEAGGEVFVSNLNSIVQRVAGTSVAEIDNLISELEQLREHLHHEGQRVQREVVAYAQMSQAAMRSTKIIVESMAHFKQDDDEPGRPI
jgi:transposase